MDTIETLYVATPFATTEILFLTDGKATWMPHLTGSYVFTVKETDIHAGASQYIIVREALAKGFDATIPIIVTVTLIIVLIAIVVYYAHYKHISLKGLFRLGKKKTSLPFD